MSVIKEAQSSRRINQIFGIGVFASFGSRLMVLLSSVRFGVVLLVLLVLACMTGMLIMQQNVEGFDKYYAQLTPSQKLIYGKLGFFDIYHSRYFNFLLLTLSLNIVLASIDRFPKAWTFISRKKLDASAHWLRAQEQHARLTVEGGSRADVAAHMSAACRSVGLKPIVTEKGSYTYVFAERGVWNRLGAYAVHVALLTIFLGGFVTEQFGRTGQMLLKPGMVSSEMSEIVFQLDQPSESSGQLPFQIECMDIQQKLLKKEGPITANNTLDWLTAIKIKDPERGEQEALVRLNHPVDYRGYRFFQASFINEGKARHITLRLMPEHTGASIQEITIKRDGSAKLADGTLIEFVDFMPDFTLDGGSPGTRSDDYENPAAVLNIAAPSGAKERVYAFLAATAKGAPVLGNAIAGYKFQLVDFEKSPSAHILSVQKDPGAAIVYLGFVLLGLTLAGVFFFSHQRAWALIVERDKSGFEVTLGGNTNRNKHGFEDRFKRLVKATKQTTDGK